MLNEADLETDDGDDRIGKGKAGKSVGGKSGGKAGGDAEKSQSRSAKAGCTCLIAFLTVCRLEQWIYTDDDSLAL